MVEKGVVEEEGRVEGENEASLKRRRTGLRLYSIYRNAGHNARICLRVGEIGNSSDSK
jgi:hypothetical protein